MSKIKKLLKDNESVLVFDVDGVLATIEFGEYNHFIDEEEWNNLVKDDVNFYTKDKVSNKMKSFLNEKDMSRVYVITKVSNENEKNHKEDFVNKYYNILRENIYYVYNENDKALELLKIKEKYPNLEDYKIIMIDDTVNVLNDVMEKTNFSTAHISSLLDL